MSIGIIGSSVPNAGSSIDGATANTSGLRSASKMSSSFAMNVNPPYFELCPTGQLREQRAVVAPDVVERRAVEVELGRVRHGTLRSRAQVQSQRPEGSRRSDRCARPAFIRAG